MQVEDETAKSKPLSYLHPKNGLIEQELAKDSHKSVVLGERGGGGGRGGEPPRPSIQRISFKDFIVFGRA